MSRRTEHIVVFGRSPPGHLIHWVGLDRAAVRCHVPDGGAGVGLAISDRAVRLHGGSLRAFNAPGGGLIMELELPLT